MWPKSTTSDLPIFYDSKVHIHNQFVKHMKGLKKEIMVSNFTLLVWDVLVLIQVGGSWEGLDHAGWVVGRHDKNGVPRDDSALDTGEGGCELA